MTKPNYIDWPEEEKKKLARAMAHDQIHKIWPPEANFFLTRYKVTFKDFPMVFSKP